MTLVKEFPANLKCFTVNYANASGTHSRLRCNECIWHLWHILNKRPTFHAMETLSVLVRRSWRWFLKERHNCYDLSITFFAFFPFTTDHSQRILIFYGSSSNLIFFIFDIHFSRFIIISCCSCVSNVFFLLAQSLPKLNY